MITKMNINLLNEKDTVTIVLVYKPNNNHLFTAHDYESHEMEGHVEDGEESVQLLCCSFQKYLHCSESVVNTTCGYETARFTKSFLDRMSGPLIQVNKKKKGVE